MKLLVCCFGFAALSFIRSETSNEAAVGIQSIETWILDPQVGTETKTFNDFIENELPKDKSVPVSGVSDISLSKEKQTCLLCKASMQAGINAYRRGQLNQEQISSVSMRLCSLITGYDENICRGLVNLNLPIFIYILDHEPKVNASSICGLIYQSEDSNDCPFEDERFEFKINLPERPKLKNTFINPNRVSTTGGKPLKVIHLTDAHLDPLYEPNGVANCDAPCCCRKGQKETSTSTKAGYWGDYGTCDTPVWAFEDILNHVKENNEDVDFIYYTGDMVDHAVWETTYESCESEIRYVSDKLKKTFGDKKVFPIIGNHEAQPVNVFAPRNITTPTLSTQWLYKLLSEEWSEWLPEQAFETLKIGGYYTALVRPGFRVIALNSNVGYRYNWWILLNPQDPNDNLKWLSNTLHEAEKSGEIVHILSHVPPGTLETYRPWGREYSKIINRFSDIIAAEFNGHTHTDEFKIYYDKENIDRPTHVAWNGGSMVTYVSYNVNYKVMAVDPETYIPRDIDTYTYNLTEANLTPNQKPKWFKEYSFKEAYEVDSLQASDVNKLIDKMATSRKDLLNKYIFFYGRGGDAFLKKVKENREKLGTEYDFEYICNIVTTSPDDKRKCNQLKEKFKAE